MANTELAKIIRKLILSSFPILFYLTQGFHILLQASINSIEFSN